MEEKPETISFGFPESATVMAARCRPSFIEDPDQKTKHGRLLPSAGFFVEDDTQVLYWLPLKQWVPLCAGDPRCRALTRDELLPDDVISLGLPSLETIVGRRIIILGEGHDEVSFIVGYVMYVPRPLNPAFKFELVIGEEGEGCSLTQRRFFVYRRPHSGYKPWVIIRLLD